MASAKSLLMALGFFFATYNLVNMIIHQKGGGCWVKDGFEFLDPVLRIPGKVMVMESANPNSRFHVAVTATDAAYSQWQCRIMYYWYNKVKDIPGSGTGNFTRILHSGRPDQLMNEIPTFVVHPLPAGLDRLLHADFCNNALPDGLNAFVLKDEDENKWSCALTWKLRNKIEGLFH